jgi:hypothetical protein
MPQWTQSPQRSNDDSWKAVYAVFIPDEFIFLIDMGLHNAGWTVGRSGNVFELHEVIGGRTKFCWARDLDKVEVVSPTLGPDHQHLAAQIYADAPDRADSDKLVQLLDDLFSLVGNKQHADLDLLMKSLNVSRSAPEYLVGILRATSNDTQQLPHWGSFLSAVRAELIARKLDATSVLVGLI